MNGYVLNLRLRRTGAEAAKERTWAITDKKLTRFGRGVLFALGIALLLLGPLAMAALTAPERGEKDLPLPDFISSLPHFS